jgi:hypothetical protein
MSPNVGRLSSVAAFALVAIPTLASAHGGNADTTSVDPR